MEYSHLCYNKECNNRFDLDYSMHDDPPTTCPKCNQETVKRLITFRGAAVVELYGDDFKAQVRKEANDLIKRSHTDEKLLANLVGEEKYQGNVKTEEYIKTYNKERPRIRSSRKS